MYTPSLVSALCTPSRHLFYWFPIFSQNACQQHQDKGHEPAACSHRLRSGNNSRARGFSVQKLQIQHVTESMEDNVFLPPLQWISSHMVVKCQYKMLRLKIPCSLIWWSDLKMWPFSLVCQSSETFSVKPRCSCSGNMSSRLHLACYPQVWEKKIPPHHNMLVNCFWYVK